MTKQIDELMALLNRVLAFRDGTNSQDKAIAEFKTALEAALKPGEPVAWRIHPSDAGVGHEGLYAMTDSQEQVAIWERKGWAIEPLYTAAQPIALKPVEPVGFRYMYQNFLGDEVWAFEPPRNGKVLRTVPVYTAEPPAQTPVAPRSVTPLQCPKCSALWLFWPKEQTGQEVDSLNLRSTHSCSHCESGGVAQLERLERVQENLTAQTPDALKPGEPSLNYEPVFEFASKHRVSYNELCAVVRSAYAAPPAQTPPKDDFIHKRTQLEAEWSKVRELQRQCREFIEKQKTPPPRLTDEQIGDLWQQYWDDIPYQFARAIEAAHGIAKE